MLLECEKHTRLAYSDTHARHDLSRENRTVVSCREKEQKKRSVGNEAAFYGVNAEEQEHGLAEASTNAVGDIRPVIATRTGASTADAWAGGNCLKRGGKALSDVWGGRGLAERLRKAGQTVSGRPVSYLIALTLNLKSGERTPSRDGCHH